MNKVREICKLLQMKSKMNTIKNESEKFSKKLKTLKNFFLSTNLRINSDKQYIKLVQAKYTISNYVGNFKYKKYLKYRALVKAIIERGVEKHIRSDVTPAAIMIQKHVRAYLSRLHMGELYNSIVRKSARPTRKRRRALSSTLAATMRASRRAALWFGV